ncbi:MAG: hypothetical protein COB02_08295 [Candidatus Cloacimonadota bacterium]|nr:MAG: hypothetical protein COB02_08295 [Candidatus Cloacimonadota bacterium]
MNSTIEDYHRIIELSEPVFKVYALNELALLNSKIPIQKLLALYTTKDDFFLDELYLYTCIYDEQSKNQVLIEHLSQEKVPFSKNIFQLLSSFSWDKDLLKLILKKIHSSNEELQTQLILLLAPYRFLLPQQFLKKYLFSKNKTHNLSIFEILSQSPQAEDEKLFKQNLNHENIELLSKCYIGLWKLGNTSLLLAYTSNKKYQIQAALLASKKVLPDKRILKYLHYYLNKNEAETIILALNACQHEDSIEVILNLLIENSSFNKKESLEACLRINPEQSISSLLQSIDLYESSNQDISYLKQILSEVHIIIDKLHIQISKPLLTQLQKYSNQTSSQKKLQTKRDNFRKYFLTPKHINSDNWPKQLFESHI